jgi:hypothetical protein
VACLASMARLIGSEHIFSYLSGRIILGGQAHSGPNETTMCSDIDGKQESLKLSRAKQRVDHTFKSSLFICCDEKTALYSAAIRSKTFLCSPVTRGPFL